MSKKNLVLIIAIITLAAASRLVRHPANFTPIAAMAMFGGWYFTKKYYVIIPLIAMLVSDAFIGFYDWRLMTFVYIGIALTFIIGWVLKKNPSWHKVAIGSLTGSIIFFLITNFAVWSLYSWYPHTGAGLLNCFAMALPFFKNSLAGDLFYSVALFGVYELVWYYASVKQTKLMKI
jgi:hypothetical protein